MVGFDFEAAKLILEKLAELHGTSLALKMLRPEVFEKKLMPFFGEFNLFEADAITTNMLVENKVALVKHDEVCATSLDKIINTLYVTCLAITKRAKNCRDYIDGLYSGFVHSDLWINNIMVKLIDNQLVDVKFVDFQIYEYSSLMRDVVFFLFSSVQIPVLQNHYDNLISCYYDNLIKTLKILKCDTSRFSFESFENELEFVAKEFEYFHVIFMLETIYASPKSAINVEDISSAEQMVHKEAIVSEAQTEKAVFVTREFIKRGWLL